MTEEKFNQFYKSKMDRSISNVGVRCKGALSMFAFQQFLNKYLTAAPNSAILFFRAQTAADFFFGPLHGGVPIVSSAILFAIGITIDIAIGFIFLLFFSLGGLPPQA